MTESVPRTDFSESVLHGGLLSQAHRVVDWVCLEDFALSRIVPHLGAARDFPISGADEKWLCKERGPSSPRRKLALFRALAPAYPPGSESRPRSIRRKLGLFGAMAPGRPARS